jgi:outer membrane protein TolC
MEVSPLQIRRKTTCWLFLCLVFFSLLSSGAAEEGPPAAASPPKPGAGGPSEVGGTELDLSAACGIALEQNPSLQAAIERVTQAGHRLRQAQAQYWPTLQGTLTGTRAGLSDREYEQNAALIRIYDPDAAVDDPQELYAASLQASLLLFNGLKRHFTNLAARTDHQRSIWAKQEVKRSLLQAVSRSYYSAQLARANIRIARADEAFQKRQLQEAQSRQQAGTGSLSEVLNFKVRLNAARTSRIRAEEGLQAALASLAALMGYETGRLPSELSLAPLRRESRERRSRPGRREALAYALAHRPDLKAQQHLLETAQARSKALKGDYFPDLHLRGELTGSRQADVGFEQEDVGYAVSLNLTYTFFNGGRRRAELGESRARMREARHGIREINLGLAAEIEEAMAGLEAAEQQLELQRSNVRLVKAARDLVEKEYAAGVGSLVRLNEAQRDLIRAESEFALALVAVLQAGIDLQASTGRILEMKF